MENEQFIDPTIEEEADKFNSEMAEEREKPTFQDKFRKMVKGTAFVMGLAQFMSTGAKEAQAATAEKIKGDAIQTASYHLCQNALPREYILSRSNSTYDVKEGAFNEKLTEWCKKGGSIYTIKFASHENSGNPRMESEQEYNDAYKRNAKELEVLGERYKIDVITLQNIEKSFVDNLKTSGNISKECSGLKTSEVVSDLSAEDAIFIVSHIVDTLLNKDSIPWEAKDELIEDLVQYLTMRASQDAVMSRK